MPYFEEHFARIGSCRQQSLALEGHPLPGVCLAIRSKPAQLCIRLSCWLDAFLSGFVGVARLKPKFLKLGNGLMRVRRIVGGDASGVKQKRPGWKLPSIDDHNPLLQFASGAEALCGSENV